MRQTAISGEHDRVYDSEGFEPYLHGLWCCILDQDLTPLEHCMALLRKHIGFKRYSGMNEQFMELKDTCYQIQLTRPKSAIDTEEMNKPQF